MQLYPVAKMAMNLHLKLFDDMSTSTDVSLTYYLSSVVQLVRKLDVMATNQIVVGICSCQADTDDRLSIAIHHLLII